MASEALARTADPSPPPFATAVHSVDRTRWITLDVMRGSAVFGMLLANILSYGFPLSAAEEWGWQGAFTPDFGVILLLTVFVSGKFYGLFALLFGMGIALQQQRAGDKGTTFLKPHLRRMGVLLVLGLAHAILLWYGDILAYYALLGFVVLLFLRCHLRTLMVCAILLFLLPVFIIVSCQRLAPQRMPDEWLDWQSRASVRRATLESRAVAPETIAADLLLRTYEFLGDERRVFRQGTFGEMALHRSGTYFVATLPLKLIFISGNTLAMFLFGMYLARRQVFLDSSRHDRLYIRMLLLGVGLGLPLQAAALVTQALELRNLPTLFVNRLSLFAGNLALSLAYAGLVAHLCLRRGWRQRLRPIAAVGRTALTNYLLQSVICGFLFYSYGLALFGELSVVLAVFIAVILYAVQAAVSFFWLRSFRFGPFEWVWRSLSYGAVQPFR